MSRLTEERNQDATVYIGNLDERCTEALIWELMLQAGPVGKFSFTSSSSSPSPFSLQISLFIKFIYLFVFLS